MDDKIYTALGLMSGTSLDGVDVAVIETDGVDIFGFGDTDSLDFDRIIDAGSNETVKSVLRKTISAALEWQFQGQSPNIFALAEDICDDCHIQAISNLIGFDLEYPWITNLEVIGYHGLTVLHHPPKNEVGGKTLQIGSGQRLSDVFDLPVVYDFRTADVEAGGQGAPLAPIYHEALVRFSKLEGRIAVLNIGGVSNVTAIEDGQIVWSTDCGPGNGPLDSWVWALTDNDYDVDGRSSLKGRVDFRLVNQWLKSDFFTRSIPRSADRYDFDVLSDIKDKSLEDGAASLASFCAQAVARDLQAFKAEIVIVCGGGRKNPAIMGMLDMHIEAEILSAEDVGWDGDMLEAQAFAYLAVRTLKGLPISFPETTGASHPLTGGKIAYPSSSLGSRGGE